MSTELESQMLEALKWLIGENDEYARHIHDGYLAVRMLIAKAEGEGVESIGQNKGASSARAK